MSNQDAKEYFQECERLVQETLKDDLAKEKWVRHDLFTSNTKQELEAMCIAKRINSVGKKHDLQYRSKVSYHLSSRFSRDESLVSRDETLASRDETLVSRDETLVSREPLRRKVWNKLRAVILREND